MMMRHSTSGVPSAPGLLRVSSFSGGARTEARLGFTLIELMVVIAIIAILAGFIVALTAPAGEAKVRSRVTTELQGIRSAIEAYNKKYGFYPPDNPADPAKSPLYYELTGNDATPAEAAIMGVKGIANADKNDKGQRLNFFQNLRPAGYGQEPGQPYYLKVPFGGPSGNFNVWKYRSSKPKNTTDLFHNTETFDLWADVVVGGKTYTFSNW
jgi:prepilin-type N-terminal cleavage/methylation domain-containing protein